MFIKFRNLQSMEITYINGEFYNAHLQIWIEKDDQVVVDQMVVINNHRSAMEALRRIEKLAGKAASMTESTGYSNNHHRYTHIPANMRTEFITKAVKYNNCEYYK